MGFDGMLVVFFSSLLGGCWSFSGSFLVFVHDGILGFLVADYALLWFRLFMLCFMSSGSLFLVSVMSSLFASYCLGLLLVCCWLLLGSATLFLSSVLLWLWEPIPLAFWEPVPLLFLFSVARCVLLCCSLPAS